MSGATDGFIAGKFQRHFLLLGLKGGAVGGGAAIVFFGVAEAANAWLAGTASGDQVEALFGSFSISYDLGEDRQVAGNADGDVAEQGRGLVAARSPGEPGVSRFRSAEEEDRRAAADGAALEAEQQEMALELPGDETVFRAHIVQHLDGRMFVAMAPRVANETENTVTARTRAKTAMPAETAGPAMARMRWIEPR